MLHFFYSIACQSGASEADLLLLPSPGVDVNWCQLWLWDGDVWVPQHLSGARFPSDHGRADSPGFIQEQQNSEEDQEEAQTPFLDRSLPSKSNSGPYLLQAVCTTFFLHVCLLCVTLQGAKLFYLSGMVYGEYQTQEVKNLGRFISVMKFRPLVWQTSHPYVLVDR